MPESRGDLHQPAKLDHLVEIAWGRHQKGKDDCDLIIAVGEPGQLFATLDDPPPIRDDLREAALEGVELTRLAAVKGDVLRILAQPDQAETKVGFVTLLIEIEPDQRMADPPRQHRADDGVDQRRQHHVAGNIDRSVTAQRDRQGTGQGPQDREK